MPTNTTTPEAATTTTPATNNNTTPLSAMTGEEVASILVGLIRQNDGVIIQQKVTDGINQSAYVSAYATLAADIVSGRAAIVARMRAAGVDIPANATYQQVENKLSQYFPLIASGCKFKEGYSNYNFGDSLFGNNITEINAPNLISLPSPNSLQPLSLFLGVKKFIAPNITSLPENTFRGCDDLIVINILKATVVHNMFYTNCTKLIDLTIGASFNSNINFSNTTEYNPTVALDNSISSLCFDDDTTTYATEMAREGRTTSFSNNREKWNFLIRQHFAYNLPDRTGLTAYTITFKSNVLSAMEQATRDAFTNKGWVIA